MTCRKILFPSVLGGKIKIQGCEAKKAKKKKVQKQQKLYSLFLWVSPQTSRYRHFCKCSSLYDTLITGLGYFLMSSNVVFGKCDVPLQRRNEEEVCYLQIKCVNVPPSSVLEGSEPQNANS